MSHCDQCSSLTITVTNSATVTPYTCTPHLTQFSTRPGMESGHQSSYTHRTLQTVSQRELDCQHGDNAVTSSAESHVVRRCRSCSVRCTAPELVPCRRLANPGHQSATMIRKSLFFKTNRHHGESIRTGHSNMHPQGGFVFTSNPPQKMLWCKDSSTPLQSSSLLYFHCQSCHYLKLS